MSRVGRRPINIPAKVDVSYIDRVVKLKGPKGTLSFAVPNSVELVVEGNILKVQADYQNDSQAKMLMGTTQATIRNMMLGVTEGYKKQLNLVGVGYRASISGSKLELNLGYSHPVVFQLPEGVKGVVNANTQINLESCDKHLLGQAAANIQSCRPPEPYKGKGILFEGEIIRRKVGKTGKK